MRRGLASQITCLDGILWKNKAFLRLFSNRLAYWLTRHLSNYDHSAILDEEIITSETGNLDIFSLLESLFGNFQFFIFFPDKP